MEYIFTLLLCLGLISFLVISINYFLLWYHTTSRHCKIKNILTNNIDPVCGLKLKEKQGYSTYHKGHVFRFCSKKCVDKFDANPNKYIEKYTSISFLIKTRTRGL